MKRGPLVPFYCHLITGALFPALMWWVAAYYIIGVSFAAFMRWGCKTFGLGKEFPHQRITYACLYGWPFIILPGIYLILKGKKP